MVKVKVEDFDKRMDEVRQQHKVGGVSLGSKIKSAISGIRKPQAPKLSRS